VRYVLHKNEAEAAELLPHHSTTRKIAAVPRRKVLLGACTPQAKSDKPPREALMLKKLGRK
jgi:hypothetical protein